VASHPPDDLIALGVIRKPHGVRGEASVEPWTDSPDRFAEIGQAVLVSPDGAEQRSLRILSARAHSGRALVLFEGIETPEEITALRGWTIEIPVADARDLDENEYFLHDLIGLSVEDASGLRLGEITSTSDGGGGLLLTVSTSKGGSFDIPFATEICRSVDLESKRMVVELPDGLADLQAWPADSSSGTQAVVSERQSESAAVADRSETSPLRFDVVTIFPKMFEPLLAEGIIARGIKAGKIDVRIWDLRDFATDRHRSTDDGAYGGGAGMVMLAEPVFRCVEAIRRDASEHSAEPLVLIMSPQGSILDQTHVRELAVQRWLILLCGRYEGFDERVREGLAAREVSVGDFVVSGGELPAMLVIDAVSRLIEGVVGDRNSVEADSFYNGLLDYPHYTRPAEVRGMSVPDVLLSGHFENIRRWRKEESLRATLEKRPDLLALAVLDSEAMEILTRLREKK